MGVSARRRRDRAEESAPGGAGRCRRWGAADQVGVPGLHLARPRTRRARTRLANPGAYLSILGLHPVGEALAVVAVPDAADPALAGVRWDCCARACRPTGPPCRRGNGGVGGRHLPGEEERLGRDRARRDLAERLGHLLDRVGDVDGPGGVRWRHRPGPARPGPIHLDRRGVELEAAHRPDRPRRQLLVGDQPAVEVRAATSAMTARPAAYRCPSAVVTPVARPRSTRMRTTGAEHRIVPPLARTRLARACAGRPAPPSGTGEADRLAEHAAAAPSAPSRRRRAGCRRGRRCRQQPRALAAEPCPAELAGGRQQGADEVEAAHGAQARQRGGAGPDRGNGARSASTRWPPIRSPRRCPATPGRRRRTARRAARR